MRLVDIHVDGFGKLVNITLQLSSGFNLIFGVNEAGKSTMQQAILCLLYGFFCEDRRVRDEEWRRLAQAGIDCTLAGLDTALVQFNEGLTNFHRRQAAQQAYEVAIQHHHALPDAHACLE